MVRAKRLLGEVLSAVEFLDRASLSLVLAKLEGTRDPLPGVNAAAAAGGGGAGGGGAGSRGGEGGGGEAGPFYMVVETSGSKCARAEAFVVASPAPSPLAAPADGFIRLIPAPRPLRSEAHDREKLDAFLSDVVSGGLALDGTVAESAAQQRELWGLRERVTEALVRAGAVYKYDVSLPTHRMYEAVEAVRRRLRGTGAVTVGYGHVGDGNLHLNVSTPAPDERVLGARAPAGPFLSPSPGGLATWQRCCILR